MDRTINMSQIFDISLQKMWKSLWANCFSKLSLDFGDNFIEWLHFAQPPRGASMGSGLKILVSRPFRTPNNAIESWVAGKFKIDGVSLVCLLHTLNVKTKWPRVYVVDRVAPFFSDMAILWGLLRYTTKGRKFSPLGLFKAARPKKAKKSKKTSMAQNA